MEIVLQGGIHVPLTLHRSGLAVNGKNVLMAGGTNIVILSGILNWTILDDGNIVKRVRNRVAKG